MNLQDLKPALQFVSHAAADKNELRYYLQTVHVQVNCKESITLTASDGHRIASCIVLGAHTLDNGEYLLDIESTRRAIKLMKYKKRDEDIKCVFFIHDNQLQIEVHNAGTILLSIDLIDGKFPDIKRCIETLTRAKDIDSLPIGLNARYLMQASKAAEFISNNYNCLTISHNGSKQIFMIEIETLLLLNRAFVAIMPMTLGKKK